MTIKMGMAMCIALMFCACAALSTEGRADRNAADAKNPEIFIAQVNFPSMVPDSLVFSRDYMHVAYVSREENSKSVILDGKGGKRYAEIVRLPIFSPDGSYMVYAAEEDKKQFVVVSSAEGKKYAEILTGSLIFSPDGKKVAYIAREGGKEFLVIDGEEGRRFDEISVDAMSFSPDGRKVAYVGREGNKVVLVVNGREYDIDGDFPLVGIKGVLVFDSKKTVSYIVVRDNSLYRIRRNIGD